MIDHETLRRLDYWLGVPACALLTALRRLCIALGLRRQLQARPLRRVLFIQLAESGSMVLADPAMRMIAATGAQPYCVTFAANRASLAVTGTLAETYIFTLRTASATAIVADAWRFMAWVRRNGIDAVVDCELFSRLTAALCLLSGIRLRAGFHRANGIGLYRGDLYTHPVAFNLRLHMAQNYLLLAQALLGAAPRLPLAEPDPQLRPRQVTVAEFSAVRAKLAACLPDRGEMARLVLVNANASALLPQRRWPEEHFVALIRKLLEQFADVSVLLIGAAEDGASTAAIAGKVGNKRCIDVAGLFPLNQLPALFSLSAAMVSNDSGPAHFAAVTALPVIVLFGPETPVLFRPLGRATVLSAGLACSPCVNVGNQRRTRCNDNQCMKQIAVARVFAATRAVLETALPVAVRQPQVERREAIEA